MDTQENYPEQFLDELELGRVQEDGIVVRLEDISIKQLLELYTVWIMAQTYSPRTPGKAKQSPRPRPPRPREHPL